MNISEHTVKRYLPNRGHLAQGTHSATSFEQLILVRLLSENASIYLYEVKHELESVLQPYVKLQDGWVLHARQCIT